MLGWFRAKLLSLQRRKARDRVCNSQQLEAPWGANTQPIRRSGHGFEEASKVMRGQQDHSTGRFPLVLWEDLEEGPDIPGPGEPAGVKRWGWARTLGSMW